MSGLSSSEPTNDQRHYNNYDLASNLLDAIEESIVNGTKVEDTFQRFRTGNQLPDCRIIELLRWVYRVARERIKYSSSATDFEHDDENTPRCGLKAAKHLRNVIMQAISRNESLSALQSKLSSAFLDVPAKDIFTWFCILGEEDRSDTGTVFAQVLKQVSGAISAKEKLIHMGVVATGKLPAASNAPSSTAETSKTPTPFEKIWKSAGPSQLPQVRARSWQEYIPKQNSSRIVERSSMKRKVRDNDLHSDSISEWSGPALQSRRVSSLASEEPRSFTRLSIPQNPPAKPDNSQSQGKELPKLTEIENFNSLIQAMASAHSQQPSNLSEHIESTHFTPGTNDFYPFPSYVTQPKSLDGSHTTLGSRYRGLPLLELIDPAHVSDLSSSSDATVALLTANIGSSTIQLHSLDFTTPITPDEYNTPNFFQWRSVDKPSPEIISRVCRLLLQLNAADLLLKEDEKGDWRLRRNFYKVLQFCHSVGNMYKDSGWRKVTREELRMTDSAWTPIWDKLHTVHKSTTPAISEYDNERPEIPGEDELRQQMRNAKSCGENCPAYSGFFLAMLTSTGGSKVDKNTVASSLHFLSLR
jgi:hypothetical protein